MGGLNVACRISKTALLHVTVARNKAVSPVGYQNLICSMSLTILGLMLPVKVSLGSPCRPVDFKNAPCRPSDFKKRPCLPGDFKKRPCRPGDFNKLVMLTSDVV